MELIKLKNTTKIENLMNGIKNRVAVIENRISELEDSSIEFDLNRERKQAGKKEACKTITKNATFISRELKHLKKKWLKMSQM